MGRKLFGAFRYIIRITAISQEAFPGEIDRRLFRAFRQHHPVVGAGLIR
jgi:hypothetical protein